MPLTLEYLAKGKDIKDQERFENGAITQSEWKSQRGPSFRLLGYQV